MTRLALDWSDGPIACRECGRPTRPSYLREADAVGVWEGAVRYAGAGKCGACYRRHSRRPEPPPPTR